MDNIEWSDGFGTRFGLKYADFKTQKRTPKLRAFYFREIAACNADASLKQKLPDATQVVAVAT